jgi:RecQ family ATP-dependent DNA helicase
MNRITNLVISKIHRTFKVDDGYDLVPYLKFLTNQAKFRPGQLLAIRAATDGKNVLFVSPTGSGKSVCYQLPGIVANGPTLVVSPLKALMKDQVESIWARKIPTTYINSDLGLSERNNRYDFIKKGLYKFIFVAPERFDSKDSHTNDLYRPYSHLVIDEAHEIEMWGMAFRPSYRKLGAVRDNLGKPPVIALTATASKNTQEQIKSSLNIEDAEVIVTGFYRDNVKITTHKAGWIDENNQVSMGKENYISALIPQILHDKILIFAPTIDAAEKLQATLHSERIPVGLFHSKLEHKAKMQAQNQFTGKEHPEVNIMVSTSAFGMGVDIPNIRHIVHLAPPLSITDYVQQIGRAGRDGKLAMAHLLYNPNDFNLMKFMSSLPLESSNFKQKHDYTDQDVTEVRQKLELQVQEMIDFLEIPDNKKWSYILNYFNETVPSFWQKHGIRIVDTSLNVIIAFCLAMVFIYLIDLFT